ncbi:hypothetical protein KGQ71_05235 [Patescibacteria group bacterium]|nr:hypothetical protein [Patescibacteria group bacterium]
MIPSLLLIATAVIWRLINHQYMIAPNLEIITASSLVAATFLPRKYSLIVPLMSMAVSDALIGNSAILIFTWSAFGLIGLSGLLLRRVKRKPAVLMKLSFLAGMAASVFFFLYTNFGVWLIGDGAFYPRTWQGLIDCYVMGLPFYRTMFFGNLILVPLYFGAALCLPGLVRHLQLKLKRS